MTTPRDRPRSQAALDYEARVRGRTNPRADTGPRVKGPRSVAQQAADKFADGYEPMYTTTKKGNTVYARDEHGNIMWKRGRRVGDKAAEMGSKVQPTETQANEGFLRRLDAATKRVTTKKDQKLADLIRTEINSRRPGGYSTKPKTFDEELTELALKGDSDLNRSDTFERSRLARESVRPKIEAIPENMERHRLASLRRGMTPAGYDADQNYAEQQYRQKISKNNTTYARPTTGSVPDVTDLPGPTDAELAAIEAEDMADEKRTSKLTDPGAKEGTKKTVAKKAPAKKKATPKKVGAEPVATPAEKKVAAAKKTAAKSPAKKTTTLKDPATGQTLRPGDPMPSSMLPPEPKPAAQKKVAAKKPAAKKSPASAPITEAQPTPAETTTPVKKAAAKRTRKAPARAPKPTVSTPSGTTAAGALDDGLAALSTPPPITPVTPPISPMSSLPGGTSLGAPPGGYSTGQPSMPLPGGGGGGVSPPRPPTTSAVPDPVPTPRGPGAVARFFNTPAAKAARLAEGPAPVSGLAARMGVTPKMAGLAGGLAKGFGAGLAGSFAGEGLNAIGSQLDDGTRGGWGQDVGQSLKGMGTAAPYAAAMLPFGPVGWAGAGLTMLGGALLPQIFGSDDRPRDKFVDSLTASGLDTADQDYYEQMFDAMVDNGADPKEVQSQLTMSALEEGRTARALAEEEKANARFVMTPEQAMALQGMYLQDVAAARADWEKQSGLAQMQAESLAQRTSDPALAATIRYNASSQNAAMSELMNMQALKRMMQPAIDARTNQMNQMTSIQNQLQQRQISDMISKLYPTYPTAATSGSPSLADASLSMYG